MQSAAEPVDMFSCRAGSTSLHPGPEAAEKPASIYAHIPFCHTRCPYCSFVSYADLDLQAKKSYMQAIGTQAKRMAAHTWSTGRTFQSLYIGGGTPTAVEPESLGAFIEECLTAFRFKGSTGKPPEVTVEANPNTINLELLVRLKQAGVNRLSIGVQSFSDPMLNAIGRSHTSHEAILAVEFARSAGFQNLSLDLMYGLPAQTVGNWRQTLEKAIELSPEHLSVYELTIEEGTLFADMLKREKLDLPDEDDVAAMFRLAQEMLSAKGYVQYEISNYCLAGYQCRHNINYWQNGSYLGLGCGAVSSFSGVRLNAVVTPTDFVGLIDRGLLPFTEGEILSCTARFRETVIMGLRMTEGVSCRHLFDRFGLTPQEYYGAELTGFVEQGLVEEDGDRLRLTEKGLPLANQVLMHLV